MQYDLLQQMKLLWEFLLVIIFVRVNFEEEQHDRFCREYRPENQYTAAIYERL